MTEHGATSVSVFGAGSWGTALAILLAHDNRPTILWAHNPQHIQRMQDERSNTRYLDGIDFPSDSLDLVSDLGEAVRRSEYLLIVVPSHAFRETLQKIKPELKEHHKILWASKGLEPNTHKLLHEVVVDVVGDKHPFAVISGPTFAREVALGLPTAVTVASSDAQLAENVASRLHTDMFRAYMSDDVIGVEIGGAIKNVLAIAAGIADGLGFGANTRSALITRGLAEITRFGMHHGAKHDTFMGLAGLGDLVLTCTDNQSRNRRFGLALAEGKTPEQAFKDIGQVVEGAETARVLHEMCQTCGIEMPISEEVYKVVYQGLDAHRAVKDLLHRQQKAENSD
jgi:glycerol-3-phosphate dehydrogenase (NAD(P)+)